MVESCFSIGQFRSGLGWYEHIKVWHAICDCKIFSSVFMKQHSRYCVKVLRSGYHQSSLNHMEVVIQNISIVFWVKYFQEMVNFIIVDWFDRSGVWIWNIFRVIFNWEAWRVNLNIIIINWMMIKSPCDSWNHSTGLGGRGTGCWRLDLPLSWWLIWFFAMKGFELINISSETWWEELRATDDVGINLVLNPSTSFANTLTYHAEIYNKCLDRCCIIVDGILRTKVMRVLTWSGQCRC